MKLTFEDIAINDKKGYFYAYELNGLFEVDMNSFNCELLYSYDCNTLFDDVRLFGAIKCIDDVIVLAPMKASHIVLFCLKERISKCLEIPTVNIEYNEYAKFYCMATRGKDCYLIGHAYPGILKVNIESFSVEVVASFENVFGQEIKEKRDLFRNNVYVKDDCFWVASCARNLIIKYDMENDKYTIIPIGKSEDRFGGVFYNGSRFLLTPYWNKVLVSCDENKKGCSYKYFEDYEDKENLLGKRYSKAIEFNGKIIIFPLMEYSTIIFDYKTDELCKIDTCEIITKNGNEIRGVYIFNERVYICDTKEGCLYELDIENKRYIYTGNRLIYDINSTRSINYAAKKYSVEDYDNTLEKYLKVLAGTSYEKSSIN